MTPAELDAQSKIKVDRWIEVHSQECKDIDDGLHWFTIKCMNIGFEDGFMFVDTLGRIWGRNRETSECYPFHTEHGKELVGYRLAKKAAN